MTCLECATRGQVDDHEHADAAERAAERADGSAAGVCGRCGAGVCAHHARVVHLAGRPASTGSLGHGPSRQLRCGFCSSDHPEVQRADDPGEIGVAPCGTDDCLCPTGARS